MTALVLGFGLLLTGCAQSAPATEQSTTSATSTTAQQGTQAQALTTSDTWAKAAETGMSAAFGKLHNSADYPVELHQVTDAQGDEIQLHEMAGSGQDMSMKQIEGDLVIAPGAEVELAPGGNHLMFMDLKEPLVAAQTITLNLEFSDGSSTTVDFPIRNFDGAKEKYDEHAGH
ncbi:copper chaperone PCu(A)C [Arthrobacter sp. NIO-1057]|uniref:copper chaperone PCu(A)C n=1 Tax=Arthrobacter sp. NIO-1057 TaxID=993071 RepID=UPI0008180233|nr:copper chaperone PCu(A)C [Arthrobacter sp. NIO-1057]SCC49353.1 hypothetical protein GA0061084_3044 [Arthrobacter sp. NIO-1057]